MIQMNKNKAPSAVRHLEAIYNKSALQFGEVQMFGYVHSKSREEKMTYGYKHAVADHLPDVSGQVDWRGCCRFIPRRADLVVKGVHDAAGTLLSILSFIILSTGLCFFIL